MPYKQPTEAMLAFASQFGELIVVDYQKKGELNPLVQPAFDTAYDILSAFVGGSNEKGHTFTFDIQVVENHRPTAVCSALGDQCNILIFSGLLGRIIEIAALSSNLFAKGLDERVERNQATDIVGIQYLLDLMKNEQSDSFENIEEIIKHQQQSGRIAFFYYVTNYLLIFIIMHEARHGVEGHAFYLAELDERLFLGESPSDILPDELLGAQKFLEMDADTDALFQLFIDFLRGREYFSISNIEMMAIMAGHDVELGETARLDRFVAVWLSIVLLANSWRYSALFSKDTGTHPLYLDRLVNLFWCPIRLEMGEVEGSEILSDAYSEMAKAISYLSSTSDQFLPLAVNLVQKGVDGYLEMITNISPNFAELKSRIEPFVFKPPGQVAEDEFGITLHAERE